MSRLAQAPARRFFVGFRPHWLKSATLLAAALTLSACMSGGLGLQPGVDRSLVTSSIAPAPDGSRDAERISDEATVRNAVSSADIEDLGGNPVPWANAGTGTRGAISDIVEYKDGGLICRRFATTRESFDGVRLFKGRVCMVSAGAWRLEKFEEA